jgi:L-fuculose-phosphate aldolase
MTEHQARLRIAEIGRLMYQFRFLAATDGNISIRIGNKIVITPKGACKGKLTPDQLALIDLSGKVIRGRAQPSSEVDMHLTVYAERPEVNAVVHGHPLYATSFAAAGLELADRILPEIVLTLGKIPLAKYATPSTKEVGASIRQLIKDHDALLLENHGLLTVGKDINTAFSNLERVEHYAQIVYQAKMLGGYNTLNDLQSAELFKLKEPG